MAYSSWSVSFGEQPTASKWNILGTNDASFNDGTGIAAAAIVSSHLDANLAGGWIASGETWTYASASTFTISGDKTTKYSVGMKIKFTQTTVKYGVIAAVAYSAPNTTITIVVWTGYTVASAAITLPFFSFADQPQGFPSLDLYKFRVWRNAASNTGNATFLTVAFDSETYDTGNNFAAGVFTVPITGYYQFNWLLGTTTVGKEYFASALYYDGAEHSRGVTEHYIDGSTGSVGTDLIYCVAGKVVDIRAFNTATRALLTGSPTCFFSGFLKSVV